MRRLSLIALVFYGLAGGCLCSDIPNLSANLDAGASTSSGGASGGGSSGESTTTGASSTSRGTTAGSSGSASSSGFTTATSSVGSSSSSTGGGTTQAGSSGGNSASSATTTGGGSSGSSSTGTTGGSGSGSSSGGSSGGLPTWTACKTSQPFSVNANPTAWAGIPSFLIPYTNAIVAPTSPVAPTSNAELSGEVQAAWDATNLYVFVQVTDPTVVEIAGVGTDLFEEDSVEVYVDGTDSRLPAYDAGDFELSVSAFGQGEGGQDTGGLIDAGLFAYAAAITGSGYDVEFGIPWTLLIGNDGGAIGFDVAVNGNDGGGPWRLSQIMWSGDGGAFFNPQEFGQLVLGSGLCGADGGS